MKVKLNKAQSVAANTDTNLVIDGLIILNKSLVLKYLRESLINENEAEDLLRYLGLGYYRQVLIQSIIRHQKHTPA